MKGKELAGILHDYAENNPLLRFLSKLSIVLVFIYPIVFLLGTVLRLYTVYQFAHITLYVMLFSLALLLIERSWLILMISSGVQGLLELIYLALALPALDINALTDLCLFGALCVPSVLKFIAGYKATHVPKPKAPKPVKPVVSASYGAGSSSVCQKCGAAIQNPDASFCNVCGSPVLKPAVSKKPETETSSETCPVCGKAYSSPEAVFCNGCGTKRPQPEAAPVMTAQEAPAETPIVEEENCEAASLTAPATEAAAPADSICPGCGRQCSTSASFCTECGTPLRKTIAE